jgi:hypothetical protein
MDLAGSHVRWNLHDSDLVVCVSMENPAKWGTRARRVGE